MQICAWAHKINMFKISKKNLILFLFLLILLIIIFYWQNIKEMVGPIAEEVGKSTETGDGSQNGKIEPTPAETKTPAGKVNLSRAGFMDYVSKNIAELSPEKPVLGGKWYVIRFWFVKDGAAYVEYEDGHILRQILVEQKEGIEGKSEYKVAGYFEPGANEWILKSGDDPYFGKLKELYEWDDINKVWQKR